MNDIVARFNMVAAFVAGVEVKDQVQDRFFTRLCGALQNELMIMVEELQERREKTPENGAESV